MATQFNATDVELNADAIVTMPAVAGLFNCVTMVVASYTAAVAGRLTIKDGTSVIFDVDITTAAASTFEFDGINRLISDMGKAMEVRLFNGGLTVTAKLNVLGYTTDTYQ